MLYNMFPNPYKCTNIRLRRLRQCLEDVCFCAPTYLGTLIFHKLVRTWVGAYRIRHPNVSKGNEETRQGTKTIIRRLRRRL